MYKKTLNFLLFCSVSFLAIQPQAVQAVQITLTDGGNSASYDDDSSAGYYGFHDWQLDSQTLLTETALFYRIGNSGTAQTLDNLTASTPIINGNTATVTYTDTSNGFTIDLELSLTNNGSTLNQTTTVNNNSGADLDFDLYAYFDLITSNGNAGNTIEINSTNYTATQSGDRNTITTTVTENNTTYLEKRAEVDAIDLTEDILLQKLQLLSDNNLQLDNDLGAITNATYPVSFAYEWNYILANNESFQIITSSNSVAVPFDFSPSLGILLSIIFFAIARRISRWR
jgi:hypothetical protein